MAKETERKFLVEGNYYKLCAEKKEYIRQWYLKAEGNCAVRIRLIDNRAYITVKGKRTGITVDEFEYGIPFDDAQAMLDMREGFVIEKYRYSIHYKNRLWTVDEFTGVNDGLVLAEIELESEEVSIDIPDWIGKEVSGDYRYSNEYISCSGSYRDRATV